MSQEWIGRAVIPMAVGLAFALFKKYLPAKPDQSLARYDLPEAKRLPTGVFPLITCSLGVAIALGGYFILVKTNRLFASADTPALLQIYPPSAIWWFLPGFAAIAAPWPLTIFLLRKLGCGLEAEYIMDEANRKSGFDCFRVMVGMNLFLVLPIALFTLPAVPERMSFTADDIRVTHYAKLAPEIFPYAQAKRVFTIDGTRLRDGSFERHRDIVIDFSDGRRLSANAVGDGGTEPSDDEINIILTKIGMDPQHVHTSDELPPAGT